MIVGAAEKLGETFDVERCSKCGEPRDKPGQRYCRRCHRLYMRRWRERREKEENDGA